LYDVVPGGTLQPVQGAADPVELTLEGREPCRNRDDPEPWQQRQRREYEQNAVTEHRDAPKHGTLIRGHRMSRATPARL